MQKIINVLALASTVVSVAVVGTGAYVYVNKDSIIESITEKAIGGIGGDLPIGTPDLAPPAGQGQAAVPSAGLGVSQF